MQSKRGNLGKTPKKVLTQKKENKKRAPIDFILLTAAILLIVIGAIMVYSASWPEALRIRVNGELLNNPYFYLNRHIKSICVGILALLFGLYFPLKFWKKLAVVIFIIAIMLNLSILVPGIAQEHGGATRWVQIGGFGFMPSDVLKMASLIFFAYLLEKREKTINRTYPDTLGIAFILAIIVGLVLFLQRDLGTTAIIVVSLGFMFLVGGMRIPWFIFGFMSTAVGGVYFIKSSPFRMRRWMAYKEPFNYKLSEGMQTVQSLYALGTGSVGGVGLGGSKQKYFYLSECFEDFIFAIMGEEIGFVGLLIVIALYCIIFYRGLYIAMNVKSKFEKYLATGITSAIMIQSIVHISVAINLIPVTGVTLPLISYGGTSIIAFMGVIGILLAISRNVIHKGA